MSYTIEFSKVASKQLNKLPLDTQERIKTQIQELAENPRPSGVVKLKNSENEYRIRVRDYRVLYEIIDKILLITVLKVGHRREVYRDE